MRAPTILSLLVVLGVALWIRIPARQERNGTFSRSAIESAMREILPTLERALDQRFDPPIDWRIVTPRQMATVLAEDMRNFAAEGNERKGADTWAPLLGRNLATVVFAKVELDSGRLNITPRVFARLDRTTRGMFSLQSAAFRDVMLLHEMVHVHQMRRMDAPSYFGRPETVGKLQARGSVIEGHAQYVAQRVAHDIGLDDAFRDLVGISTGEIEGLPESARRIIRVMSGMQAFPYYRGHQMVERVVRDRGYEDAVAEMLREPPPDEIAVVTPEQYLPPPPDAVRFNRAARRVVRLFADDRLADHTVLSSLDLRLEWSDTPLDALREKLRPFLTADRVELSSRASVELYRCRDEVGAIDFLDVLRSRITAGDTPWTDRAVEIDPGVSGVRLWRDDSNAAAEENPWHRKRALLATSGPVCVVLRMNVAERWPGADLRRARRVLELVRSSYGDSPWSGVAREQLPAAFIKALDNPHWGVRWRAVRNLGRLPVSSPGVEAAARRALSDEDPSVRIAAMDAFHLWKRVSSLSAEVRQAWLGDKDLEVVSRAYTIVHGID